MNFWDFANEHSFMATVMVCAVASAAVQPFVTASKIWGAKKKTAKVVEQ